MRVMQKSRTPLHIIPIKRALEHNWIKEEEIVFHDNVICTRGRAPTKAILTTHLLVVDSTRLSLEDILSVSCDFYHFQILIHAYTIFRTKWVPALFGIARRRHCCISFTVQNKENLAEWKRSLEKQGCYVNCRPILVGTKGHASDSVSEKQMLFQPRKSFLVILNPYSGHGHACKIYYDKIEPLFKWAGLYCKVIKTNSPQHAQAFISSFNFHECPDDPKFEPLEISCCSLNSGTRFLTNKAEGSIMYFSSIIKGVVCVGGDGLVSEVLNGLHSQADKKFRVTPIGIIPAGSDNSLIWTVFGIRDPVCAALAIIKGQLVHTDIIAAQWTKGGAMHLAHTTFYHGFMSDVLELSAKYRKFGPLRYFVAGLIKLFDLRCYKYEIEYIPAPEQTSSFINGDSALSRKTSHNASKAMAQQGIWESFKGSFLGIVICNHQCKSVQCPKSQNLAPSALYNDGLLDLLLVERISLIQLLCFLILMQYSRHISLPFVKYVKVQCARLKSIDGHISCGIDGELIRMDSPVVISVFPHKMHLIGKRDN